MAHLSLSCLGPLQAMIDGRPVVGFKSNKVRALLIYLAVEAGRPHRREVLAGFLWPDWPDREALSNLRYALSNLRRVIGDHSAEPPYLLINRDALQFNSKSDCQLDVAILLAHKKPSQGAYRDPTDLASIEEAVSLYRGCFLEGFSVADSPAFEEWTLVKRHQIEVQLLSLLHYLVTAYEQLGQYAHSLRWARRQIELAPWEETAHQQLMRQLALSGQRSAALLQFESCRHLLLKELGVEPTKETNALYERIRSDTLSPPSSITKALPDPVVELPRYLEAKEFQVDVPVFVSRDREMAQLQALLDLALSGQGQVAFVTGDAGSGKTALIQEFGRKSLATVPELCIASGNCNAYTGIGDPYLPFREILEMLTADVEARWAAGAITSKHARRLWATLPIAAQTIVGTGQGLINTFVSGATLLERLRAYPKWPGKADLIYQLDKLIDSKQVGGSRTQGPRQSDLFEQYSKLMQAVAQQGPLMLMVDDLQWSDQGSISLLFHLGRHLAGFRILIVGAYRREEVSLGIEGTRHPLAPVINEFQREFGEVIVNVDQARNGEFVEALLDSEPNQLPASFRQKLTQITRGHPLFTVELLRGMQDRGDLVQNPEGFWVEGPALDWEILPARVEAAIAERIGRVGQPLRKALQVASVQGEDFTAEVVACVLGSEEREIIALFSSELDRKHRLVRPRFVDRLESRRISSYRFRNFLFQKYLYHNLDEVERAYLHEDVGTALEQLYGAQVGKIDVQLAWHFQEAGIEVKAVEYLRLAGEKALRLNANEEAIAHFTKGLALLKPLPASLEQAEQELALHLGLGIAWQSEKSARSAEVFESYTRARALCFQTGKTAQLCEAVGQIAIFHYVGAEYQLARGRAAETLSLAQRAGEPLYEALGHWYLGFISFALGEFTTARAHFEEVISFYQPQEHHRPFLVHGGKDAGLSAMAYDACCLWCLGYPDQARKRGHETLSLARQLEHPFSLADAICFAGCQVNEMRRDAAALKGNAEELIRLGDEKVHGWQGTGTSYLGEALVMLGRPKEGIEQMREGLTIARSKGLICYSSGTYGFLAQAQARTGRIDEGLNTLTETLAMVEENDERYMEAELTRIQADLLLMGGHKADAEASLLKAIEIARHQRARSWELRATIDLARLWKYQGKGHEALLLLKQLYGWFTEGFDTPDLQEANVLLEELSQEFMGDNDYI